ncbi:hypothetical protein [Actinomadura physcomitrii]|nr:hypothetical protein [Actinomadura physcomitrii]
MLDHVGGMIHAEHGVPYMTVHIHGIGGPMPSHTVSSAAVPRTGAPGR